MSKNDLSNLRQDYTSGSLRRGDLAADPIEQFNAWFSDAIEHEGEIDANAMVLATADLDGHPSARMVLLKGILDGSFVFFTNYLSRKGRDLTDNPRAALVFWWRHLQRQVRIEGDITKVSESYSKAYFDSRPLGSKLGAIISPQSEVVTSRRVLEEKLNEINKLVDGGKSVEKPIHWGGYAVKPDHLEFWQGRENRLHDRFTYTLSKSVWKIDRLAP